MKFIAVIHNWFIDSKGFDVIKLDSSSLEQAKTEASSIAHNKSNLFNTTACVVLEIDDDKILGPRKLTWCERLTGRLHP